MKLNLARAIVAIWLLAVVLWGYSGFEDSFASVTVRIPATNETPATTETISATFQCAAPLRSDTEPTVKGDVGVVIATFGTPCVEDRRRRRGLVVIDAALGLGLLAVSFVPLRLLTRNRSRRRQNTPA